jgi:hypothetical protein
MNIERIIHIIVLDETECSLQLSLLDTPDNYQEFNRP